MESMRKTSKSYRTNVRELRFFPTSYWGQVDLHTPDLRLTAYPLYAFSTWEPMKISYLRKIGLRCIRTNLSTTTYIDGYTQKIWDQHKIFNLRQSLSI